MAINLSFLLSNQSSSCQIKPNKFDKKKKKRESVFLQTIFIAQEFGGSPTSTALKAKDLGLCMEIYRESTACTVWLIHNTTILYSIKNQS